MAFLFIQILLQIRALGDTFLTRLSDQAFCLTLLAISTTILWIKYNKLQARFDAYREDDKKKVIEALEGSTQAVQLNNVLIQQYFLTEKRTAQS